MSAKVAAIVKTERIRAEQTVQLVVSPEIREFFLSQVVEGHGGFQSLCRTVAERLQSTSRLTLTPDEFRRVVKYATLYGDGGFQQKFRKVTAQWVNQHFDDLVR